MYHYTESVVPRTANLHTHRNYLVEFHCGRKKTYTGISSLKVCSQADLKYIRLYRSFCVHWCVCHSVHACPNQQSIFNMNVQWYIHILTFRTQLHDLKYLESVVIQRGLLLILVEVAIALNRSLHHHACLHIILLQYSLPFALVTGGPQQLVVTMMIQSYQNYSVWKEPIHFH